MFNYVLVDNNLSTKYMPTLLIYSISFKFHTGFVVISNHINTTVKRLNSRDFFNKENDTI